MDFPTIESVKKKVDTIMQEPYLMYALVAVPILISLVVVGKIVCHALCKKKNHA